VGSLILICVVAASQLVVIQREARVGSSSNQPGDNRNSELESLFQVTAHHGYPGKWP